MAVALLIGLWIQDELAFNKYHGHYDRIVQVLQRERFLGKTVVWEHQPYLLLGALRNAYGARFDHIVATVPADGALLSAGGTSKLPGQGLYMGADGPDMLTLKMLDGSRLGLSGDPHSILLSASLARTLFGDEDPVDKTITLDNQWDPSGHTTVVVRGVYEDLPRNSSFHETNFLLPWNLYADGNTFLQQQGWEDHRINIYAEVKSGVDRAKLSSSIKDFELSTIRGLAGNENEVAAAPQILLHPMSRWHLYSNFKDGEVQQGPVQFVWMMGIIGGFVLLLACINFMNLSTARSEKRAKEVGIRKTIGSLRSQLTKQFYVESFVVVTLAFVPAVMLVLGVRRCFYPYHWTTCRKLSRFISVLLQTRLSAKGTFQGRKAECAAPSGLGGIAVHGFRGADHSHYRGVQPNPVCKGQAGGLFKGRIGHGAHCIICL
jgi:putative ABC transport system permease protein